MEASRLDYTGWRHTGGDDYRSEIAHRHGQLHVWTCPPLRSNSSAMSWGHSAIKIAHNPKQRAANRSRRTLTVLCLRCAVVSSCRIDSGPPCPRAASFVGDVMMVTQYGECTRR